MIFFDIFIIIIKMFSTRVSSLKPEERLIQKFLYNIPLMDSPNVSMLITKYIYPPIQKRYLFYTELMVNWKNEYRGRDPYPIDFKFIVLAIDKVEAANMIHDIIKKEWEEWYDELDITIEYIIKKLSKKRKKVFNTFEPVLLFHSECQFTDEIKYKFSKNSLKS
jgi:hypothetical protein